MVRLLPRSHFDQATLVNYAKNYFYSENFKTEISFETIDGASVDALLQNLPVREAFLYSEAFRRQVRRYDSHDPWQLLALVFSLHFWPDFDGDPLEPLDKLSREAFALLCKIFIESRDPEIRSRLGDIIWLFSGDNRAMQIAVDAYLESGLRLEDPAQWGRAIQRYRRAAELVLNLRKRSSLRRKVGEFLLDRVRFYEGKDRYYFTEQALEILFTLRACEPGELCRHAFVTAEYAREIEDYRRARACYALVEKISRSSKDQASRLAARTAIAEIWVQEAERLDAAGDFLTVRYVWRKAILAHRRLGNEARASELRTRLRSAKRIGRRQLRQLSRK